MSTNCPNVIEDSNLSRAWGKAFLFVMERSPRNLSPLVISVTQFQDSLPMEDDSIRVSLDETLKRHDLYSCRVSAFTIFPQSLYTQALVANPKPLYATYLDRILPRLKARDPRNCHGTYFERMIDYHGTKRNVSGGQIHFVQNQIQYIIDIWNRDISKNRRTRRSALQIACYDPAKDLNGSALAGFPCLQQVSLSYDDANGLALNAYYPTQYIFDRAYGNYLGLCHLGRFMADQMGLKMVRMNCFVGQPELGGGTAKRDLQGLAQTIRLALDNEYKAKS
jgi:hypothetical protein